jgi:hypothetical protein
VGACLEARGFELESMPLPWPCHSLVLLFGANLLESPVQPKLPDTTAQMNGQIDVQITSTSTCPSLDRQDEKKSTGVVWEYLERTSRTPVLLGVYKYLYMVERGRLHPQDQVNLK